MNRFIQIDEEGYFLSEGVRWNDEGLGLNGLSQLSRGEGGAFVTNIAGSQVIVEAFDQPLVARNIHIENGGLVCEFPYQYRVPVEWSSLACDEFDRFHGNVPSGIPFVLSRTAQAELFRVAEEFDDDSLTIAGTKHRVTPWMLDNRESEQPDFWSQLYNHNDTGWDLNSHHPALDQLIPQLKLSKSRVAILGSGRSHDAAFFARQGHLVTAFDYSEVALAEAKKLYGDIPNLKFVTADIFNLPNGWNGQFDVVFDHTLYCAVLPSLRAQLGKIWSRLLVSSGFLLGIFFVVEKRTGPPWGATEWEIRSRTMKQFRHLYWQRLRMGPPRRLGRELFVMAQRLNQM